MLCSWEGNPASSPEPGSVRPGQEEAGTAVCVTLRSAGQGLGGTLQCRGGRPGAAVAPDVGAIRGGGGGFLWVEGGFGAGALLHLHGLHLQRGQRRRPAAAWAPSPHTHHPPSPGACLFTKHLASTHCVLGPAPSTFSRQLPGARFADEETGAQR